MRVLDVHLHGLLLNLHGLAFLVALRCKQVHEEKQKHQRFFIWNQTQLGENNEAKQQLEEDAVTLWKVVGKATSLIH